MAHLYFGKPPSGRPELRVTWTYEDGTEVCVADIKHKARVLEKMVGALDLGDLALLSALITKRHYALGIRPGPPARPEPPASPGEDDLPPAMESLSVKDEQ